jgi:hypothetical protein
MEKIMLDPTQFSITQSKSFSIWPPSDLAAHGIIPYIKRLRTPTVTILDVGIMKGENAMFLLESEAGKKIEKIYGVKSYDPVMEKENEFYYYEGVLKENIKNEKRINLNYKNKEVDVVCIHAHSDLEKNLETYYTVLREGGIFCGNEQNLTKVKVALSNFRRMNKIGIPIMVANGCWFWFKKA